MTDQQTTDVGSSEDNDGGTTGDYIGGQVDVTPETGGAADTQTGPDQSDEGPQEQPEPNPGQ